MAMTMSAPSSSFHDYLAIDASLPKMEAMTPIQAADDQFGQGFDYRMDTHKNHSHRNIRNSVVKRPMNAFLLWARGERKRVSSDGYGVSQTSLSKLLGETWRRMPIEEKQPFLDMAETLKRQHHIDHPDYKFKSKQRSTATKKHHLFASQQLTATTMPPTVNSLPPTVTSIQPSLSPTSSVVPHPVQSSVLAMCQSIISTPTSPMNDDDWFGKMVGQPQTIILAPVSRTQTFALSSRRAVRIQIINKHDDIALPPPALLSMTPPPPLLQPPPSLLAPSSITATSSSSLSSSFLINESTTTTTLVDYLVDNCNIFNIPPTSNQQILASDMNDPNEYDTLHDSSVNQLTDLDQHYDSNSWIDTPLSSFGTNSTDLPPSSPYASYDFLCL